MGSFYYFIIFILLFFILFVCLFFYFIFFNCYLLLAAEDVCHWSQVLQLVICIIIAVHPCIQSLWKNNVLVSRWRVVCHLIVCQRFQVKTNILIQTIHQLPDGRMLGKEQTVQLIVVALNSICGVVLCFYLVFCFFSPRFYVICFFVNWDFDWFLYLLYKIHINLFHNVVH